jgi:multisubunit Na+/H+ antiporter MnhG subunit
MNVKSFFTIGRRITGHASLFLVSNKRLVLFVAIPYISIMSIYHYIFDLSAPLFPLSQVPYLLFKHTAIIQSNLQTSLESYRFIAFPEWLHYIWIPLICFVFNFVISLCLCFAHYIQKTGKAGNLEIAFIQTQHTLTNNAYWALVTTGMILPLGLIWSFSHQIELIRQVLLSSWPLLAFFLTSFFFDIILLCMLWIYQWFSVFILPIIAFEQLRFKDTFDKALKTAKKKGIQAGAALLVLSIVWVSSRLVVKEYVSAIVPIIINTLSLVIVLLLYEAPTKHDRKNVH